MGADTFDAFLKTWYQDHMFREVTTKEFRAAAEEASGGSQAMFLKLNTFGEEAFLESISEAVARYQ